VLDVDVDIYECKCKSFRIRKIEGKIPIKILGMLDQSRISTITTPNMIENNRIPSGILMNITPLTPVDGRHETQKNSLPNSKIKQPKFPWESINLIADAKEISNFITPWSLEVKDLKSDLLAIFLSQNS